jgi:hypothetical protein
MSLRTLHHRILGPVREWSPAWSPASSPAAGRTHRRSNSVPRLIRVGALAATLALVATSTALAGLAAGSLPTTAFTFTSVTDNSVDMTGNGIHLKTKRSVNVKTTYSRVPVNPNFFFGWHYHNGPVIVTVTVGTLTYFDKSCQTWDLTAGHSYIESTGQVLNVTTVPAKNDGIANVEWFTTRLYPEGTTDPVNVAAPCAP